MKVGGPGVQEEERMDCGRRGGWSCSLYLALRGDFSDTVRIPSRRNNKYKSPELEECLACVRTR